ncbi:hypothetical protein M408DRAFT_322982 [Serendipita vermifera MAFF 305830]|uniref:Intradiol ring-cleavage dioxygenases domain-containing protein n=1 Tax=Serendipita vermifera MAFF 305830 TaxID=933852 RepID=A0A0C3ACU8_SERVB|nr:hypothetical protein M408DRAFT_322982 [Serendipita vermifera MAFF 305830]
MLLNALLAAVSLVSCVQAHAEPSTPFSNHPVEVARRQLEMNKRHVMARNCASQVAAYQKNRKAKRAFEKRHLPHGNHPPNRHVGRTSTVADTPTLTRYTDLPTSITRTTAGVSSTDVPTSTYSAIIAHYSTIQNLTSSLIDVRGSTRSGRSPYYLRDDYVRQDLREDQEGTTLVLDIGVLDMATCQPATDVFVEIWNANPKGEYAAFGSADIVFPTGTESFTAFPSGEVPPAVKISADNFLRGGYPANENGVVELTTIYPGFYTGRTVHTHVMIHQNINYHDNGTIISASGAMRHTGQLFYDDEINNQVLAQPVYEDASRNRTYNSQDFLIQGANEGGYNFLIQGANEGGYSAFVDIEFLGETLADGLLGYISAWTLLIARLDARLTLCSITAIGIDTTASRNISTSNYWDPDFGSEVTE